MRNFGYCNPTRILFGAGQIASLGQLIPADSRVLVTHGGGSILQNGMWQQVEQALCEPTTEEMLKGHGRGIPLLLRVCEEVRYSGPGNRVEVLFRLAERATDSPR